MKKHAKLLYPGILLAQLVVYFLIPITLFSQVYLEFSSESKLLKEVDREIQDSVIKRIKMDMNPNVEHYKNTIQTIKYDIPPIDFSSLLFVPVLLSPRTIMEKKQMDVLAVHRNSAFIYGKTKNGQNIYIDAQYEILNIDTTSAHYRELTKLIGKEKQESFLRKIKNRNGIDNWTITIYKPDDIVFQTIEYARQESDDGKFFILKKGKHYSEICYFKDGKPMSCRKSDQYDAIRVRPFEELIR